MYGRPGYGGGMLGGGTGMLGGSGMYGSSYGRGMMGSGSGMYGSSMYGAGGGMYGSGYGVGMGMGSGGMFGGGPMVPYGQHGIFISSNMVTVDAAIPIRDQQQCGADTSLCVLRIAQR